MRQTLFRILASWWLFFILALFVCASYLAFTFHDDPAARLIRFLFHSPAGALLYGGLCVNLLSVNIRIIAVRLQKKNHSIQSIKSMDAWAEIPAAGADSFAAVVSIMKRRGARFRETSGAVGVEPGFFSFLPGVFFRTCLILLLFALFASAQVRKTEETILRTGETVALLGTNVTLTSIDARLPEDFLSVGDDASFMLDQVSAVVQSEGATRRISPRFPVWINDRSYRVVHLGYSQPLRFNEMNHEELIALDILPPGKTQIISPPSHKNVLTLSLAPERIIDKGLVKGKQYNLAEPMYSVVFQNTGKNASADTVVVRPGHAVTKGPLSVSLGQKSFFIKIQAVKDPALLWIYAALAMSLAGVVLMCSRFFWYHAEVAAVKAGSAIYFGASQEFFKKWGIEKFRRTKERLLHAAPADHGVEGE